MTQVDLTEAKKRFSRFLERAHTGEEVVIATRGKPLARLLPLPPPRPREPGLLAGAVEDSFFEPLPEEELEAWER